MATSADELIKQVARSVGYDRLMNASKDGEEESSRQILLDDLSVLCKSTDILGQIRHCADVTN